MIDCSRVQQLMDAKSVAWEDYKKNGLSFDSTKAIFDSGFSGPFGAALRAAFDASAALRREQKATSAAFAAARGWRVARRGFTLNQLRDGRNVSRWRDYEFRPRPIDHPEYFRLATRPWRPVAIVSHEYSPFSESIDLAQKYELTAELLPASWYFPGHCNAILYRPLWDLLE